MKIRAGAHTHPGSRKRENEDSYLSLPEESVFVVADGMGGHEFGQAASRIVVDKIAQHFRPEAPSPRGILMEDAGSLPPRLLTLIAAVTEANVEIFRTLGGGGDRTAGSTTVGLVVEDERMHLVNVGDSRIYLIRGGDIERLTVDHSQVQEMVNEGIITPAQAREHPMSNVLTRAVGTDENLPVDAYRFAPRNGDRLIVCSDGVPRELTDQQILDTVVHVTDPEVGALKLVHESVERGGHDNITAIMLTVDDVSEDRQTKEKTPAAAVRLGSYHWLPETAKATEPPSEPKTTQPPPPTKPSPETRQTQPPRSPFLLFLALGILGLVAYLVWKTGPSY